MNQKELSEIRRRFKPDKCSITRLFGCYVNASGEIIADVESSLAMMQQEEQEMYLTLLKKALSGTLGKNLMDIEFTTQQVADSQEHRLLQTLRTSLLEDRDARQALYEKLIGSVDLEGQNYLILLAADTYDVPHRSRDDMVQADASEEVFTYFVCSICPVKPPKLSLRFSYEDSEFHSASTGNTVAAPELGFMFPAFDDRSTNIYNALFYTRNPGDIRQEVIDAVFKVTPPMSAVEQKNVFQSTLCDVLDRECSYDVVQSVHEQIRTCIEEHKESHSPEPPDLSIWDVGSMLISSGVSGEKADAFREECEKRYGDAEALDPRNIVENKKFEVCTPEVKISVAPESSCIIETRVIDGRKYLLIPAEDGVEVNGISVTIQDDGRD